MASEKLRANGFYGACHAALLFTSPDSLIPFVLYLLALSC